MSDLQFSLSEYLSAVQEIIKMTFDDAVWVKAEIRNFNIKGDHYHIELAEKKQDSDKVVASYKANICKFVATKIVGNLNVNTGMNFSA